MMRLLACVKRDWLIYASYRISTVIGLGHIVFTAAAFYFIAKLIDPQASPALAPYGGGYFPFVLLGLAFSRYLTTSLYGLSGNLRDEQIQGTLEAMAASPTRSWVIAVGGVGWDMLRSLAEVAAYLVIGAVVFGIDLGQMNVPATVVLLVLTVVSLSSLGVLSASGVLLFKEADPVNAVLGGLMKLVGGVYFPVALLPDWLEPLAKVFPLTYALEGLRRAVLTGASLGELWRVCLILGGFAVVLWPLALAGFSWTLRRMKRTGTLSFR